MPHTSVFSDVDIPDEDVVTFLFKNIKDYENSVAIVEDDTGREITYSNLYRSVRCVAKALISRGFQHQDVLCIYASERIDWVIAALAAAAAGGTFSGCNPRYPPAELQHHVETVNAQYLVFSIELLEPTRNLVKSYSKFKEVFVFGSAVAGFVPFGFLVEHDDLLPGPGLDVQINPSSSFSVSFSSGTTGAPKGVALPHRSVVANTCQNSHPDVADMHGSSGVFTGDLPLLHVAGQLLLMCQPLSLGAKLILISMHKDPTYKFERFLKVIKEHKVRIAHLLPHMGGMLLKSEAVGSADLSSLTAVYMCGAPMGAAVQQQIAQKLPKHIHVGNLYGTTEAAAVSWTRVGKPVKPGSVGMILPNADIKIIDVSTQVELTEPFGKGEVWIRTPAIFTAYVGRPDLTAQVLDDEGYYHTGDIAYFDDEEYLFIIDRIKDVMFYNGSCIWPSDLEDLIKSHPEVVDVGVIGIPDPPDDLPKAFVVKKPGSVVTTEDIISFVEENVAVERRLRGGVEFIEHIPRTLSGKIMRKDLKKL